MFAESNPFQFGLQCSIYIASKLLDFCRDFTILKTLIGILKEVAENLEDEKVESDMFDWTYI